MKIFKILSVETQFMKEKFNMADKQEGEAKLVSLPLARVKTIMKSSPDMSHIGQESIFTVTKATVSTALLFGCILLNFDTDIDICVTVLLCIVIIRFLYV